MSKTKNIFLMLNQVLWKSNIVKKSRNLMYYVDKMILLNQKKPQRSIKEKKQVLIIYNLALGDAIMFLSVIPNLREIFPKEKFELTIACQKGIEPLFENCGAFEVVLPLSFTKATVNLLERKKVINELRKIHYDIVIDPIGCEDCSTNVLMTRMACGVNKIGVLDITLKNQQCSDRVRETVYDKVIKINRSNLHLLEFYAKFFSELEEKLILPQLAQLPRCVLKLDLPESYFITFPLASMSIKRWDLVRFAEVSKRIYEAIKIPLLVCGTQGERAIIDEFLKLVPEVPVCDIVGKTSVMEFCEVIGNATCVLTNDTSAYHIAVAQNRPTMLICGGYTFHRYANYKNIAFNQLPPLLITRQDKSCFDCRNNCKYTSYSVYPCIEDITVNDAWTLIQEYLKKAGIIK